MVAWLDEVGVVYPLFCDSIEVRYDVSVGYHEIVQVEHERFEGLVVLFNHLTAEQILVLVINLLPKLGHIVERDSLLLLQGHHQCVSREFWISKITDEALDCFLNQEVVEVYAQLRELLRLVDLSLAALDHLECLALLVFVAAVDQFAIPVQVKLTRLSDSCSELFCRFL